MRLAAEVNLSFGHKPIDCLIDCLQDIHVGLSTTAKKKSESQEQKATRSIMVNQEGLESERSHSCSKSVSGSGGRSVHTFHRRENILGMLLSYSGIKGSTL